MLWYSLQPCKNRTTLLVAGFVLLQVSLGLTAFATEDHPPVLRSLSPEDALSKLDLDHPGLEAAKSTEAQVNHTKVLDRSWRITVSSIRWTGRQAACPMRTVSQRTIS
ncbi:MAG: hypothetical protein BWX80_01841 [Candidatus Hydrogenedentes bacterium ADurb.Bin101]|nr:MAG: hypothetical protein BWX80_01841 [Candidatus Hydrogenedentes bacterium ADurb.Bin101]HOC67491.1 hypothetical protein [Candidatus Hydrogenedentota bacterium]